MNNILITIKKELRAIFRDKKFIMIIFLMPFIIPAFIIFMGFMYDNMNSSDYTIGINYNLSNSELVIINSIGEDTKYIENKTEEELNKMYLEGQIDAYILKENDVYNVYTDTSTETGMMVSSVVSSYLDGYNDYLAANYLIANGINADKVFNIVKMEIKDLAKEGTNYFSNFLINFALTYLVMIVAITAMNTTADIIVGEKERGTFETLLTFPIKSSEIVSGKFLAIVISCIISSIIGIVFSVPAFIVVKNYTNMFSDMRFNLGFTNISLSIIILILTSCLSAGVCIALTGKAKNFKEAQSSQSIISFFSMIPVFANILELSNMIMYLIPITNCGMILNEIFLGEINATHLSLVVLSTIIYIVIILLFISKQYRSEKTLF